MAQVFFPEWRHEFEATNFPFMDGVTLANDDGLFIPPDTLLDASIYPVGATRSLYLSRVSVGIDTVRLFVGDRANPELCYGDIQNAVADDIVSLQDSSGRPAGVLVSEPQRLSVFQTWPTGDHFFLLSQTGFAATVCQPLPEIGIRGFVLDSGEVFSGDVWFVGGPGVVLSMSEHDTDSIDICDLSRFAYGSSRQQHIRVDVVGDPLARRAACGESFETPSFVKTVTIHSGCEKIIATPDSRGDFKISIGDTLAEDTILRVKSEKGSVVFDTVG